MENGYWLQFVWWAWLALKVRSGTTTGNEVTVEAQPSESASTRLFMNMTITGMATIIPAISSHL